MLQLTEQKTRKARWFNETGAGDGTHEYGVFFEVEPGREIAVTFDGLADADAEVLQDALARLPELLKKPAPAETP